MKFMKSMPIQLALLAAGVAVLWSGLGKINTNLAALPVLQAQHITDQAAPMQPKPLYPVWVGKAMRGPQADDGMLAGSVEDAFRPAALPDQVDQPPPEPDYAEVLRSKVHIDGTSSNGAFVNGRFYSVGSDLDALVLDRADGGTITPRLVAASTSRVIISAGKHQLSLTAERGWR